MKTIDAILHSHKRGKQ